MSPKAPRDVSGSDLVKLLSKYGYKVIRQVGSHIRMSLATTDEGAKSITIPNHNPIKLGTLMSIINDVSSQLKISKEDIINKL
ncbi:MULTISPECIES: type II toxin-antitoxin system HicA family toxin [unclassified Mucilaginibacter]|jgi:predicted RNA binding protein YcfA (HicA-like mRNA interferase family)|uniref:type II toxin-antitoxin system HicA family toxin n=1 Tax=unclassified Mucilaginibacter TaxID=2617802 RepID=UPI0008B29C73|nr:MULTISPECIES: type II toxin-antitoxin system HicA family toxin [unclassified Mucilaginibacter]WDF77639.1 type II toxin-antitoxin system HicA family toxin [Mucilaginibacter sp. KACC 22773]SEO11783.1 Predicted RNA binding protein YcfA, dsRBD-like fold, HicA-like mRNA interferase family [Mucilaginibacter sp. OK283]